MNRPPGQTSRQGHSPFFLVMAVLCVVIAFAGFTPTYFAPLARGTAREMSAAVHIHGVLLFGWTLLLLGQTVLIARARKRMHMSVGLIGISLATAIVIFAFIVSTSANQRRMMNGDIDRAYSLGFSNLYALVAFGGLFTYAIRNRTRSEIHKRAILFSTFVLLNPPLGRLFRPVFDPAPVAPWLVFGIIDMLVLACLIFDWRRLGRLHPATVAGVVVVVLSQAIRWYVPELAIWRSSYDAILRLVS